MRVAGLAICSAIAIATGATGCEIDLTTKGFPACVQACPEWCWATVIGELKEYYDVGAAGTPPVSPRCRGYECKVVSAVRKAA